MFVSRFCAAIAGVMLLAPFFAYSGTLDSPAAPTSTGSAMYTLTDIYNRLNTGSATAKRTGAFTEPAAGPTAGTGLTLEEVMAKAPSKDDTNGASASHVLFGKTFWGLTGLGWGSQTGSMGTQTLSDGTTTVRGGYYGTATLNAVDADLATGNVRSGVSIFGVAGSLTVVDTGGGNAVAGDILSGKIAYVGGGTVTGNIATQTLSNTDTAVSAGYYAATDLTTVDTDLAMGNVRSGVSIFGVAGSLTVVDTSGGNAVAGDILSGKIAYVGGSEVTGSIAPKSLSNTGTAVSAGYYAATDLTTVDTDLATGNIRSGVTIFGVVGSSTVVETGGGNAVAGDILSGKIAYVGGGTVTGNIATQTLSDGTTTVRGGYYGTATLNAVDTDLVAANIIRGKSIFGIAGAVFPSAVEKTGQTTSYSTTGGEDGDVQRGVIWPNPRFTDNGNGTVTDNLTGLIWLKNANAGGLKNWENALTYCNNLSSGTSTTDGSPLTDWRLPNIKEMESLLAFGYNTPALPNTAGTGKWSEGNPFTNVYLDYYWTSTTYQLDSLKAWALSMGSCYHDAGLKTLSIAVWPVRGGQ